MVKMPLFQLENEMCCWYKIQNEHIHSKSSHISQYQHLICCLYTILNHASVHYVFIYILHSVPTFWGNGAVISYICRE